LNIKLSPNQSKLEFCFSGFLFHFSLVFVVPKRKTVKSKNYRFSEKYAARLNVNIKDKILTQNSKPAR